MVDTGINRTHVDLFETDVRAFDFTAATPTTLIRTLASTGATSRGRC